jgi:hypothetical protein
MRPVPMTAVFTSDPLRSLIEAIIPTSRYPRSHGVALAV